MVAPVAAADAETPWIIARERRVRILWFAPYFLRDDDDDDRGKNSRELFSVLILRSAS